jgi:hypothetical protein
MGRKYSIAIEAHGEHASETSPRISAVVQVEDDGTTQLIEMTVGTADGGPIPAGAARTIDFVMLAEALGGVVSATFAPPQREATNAREQAAGSAALADSQERPYRRMPKPAEVVAIMKETGSVGKLAEHFNVPRYTAQSWVNRLRKEGKLDDLAFPRANG